MDGETASVPAFQEWCEIEGIQEIQPITKDSAESSAWFAVSSGHPLFLKLYPWEADPARAAVETEIAGSGLHPSIVPLRRKVTCDEGVLLVFDRVSGENLGPAETRQRFQALPLAERSAAVTTVFAALAAICEAGFMIVDWYEGNMIYDFDAQRLWLFDWELCRRGDGFTLERDSNYGSSRLMAPEEFLRGRWLDQRTLVYNLGRYALLTLPELAEPLAPVLARATSPARTERYPSIREWNAAFRASLAGCLRNLADREGSL